MARVRVRTGRIGLRGWLVLSLLALGGCVTATEPTDMGGGLTLSDDSGRPIRLSYDKDLRPVFEADCVRCHGASSPAAGYAMTDYASVVQAVRPGDAASPLVVETQPLGHMFQYFSGDRLLKSSMVYTWVVEFDAQ